MTLIEILRDHENPHVWLDFNDDIFSDWEGRFEGGCFDSLVGNSINPDTLGVFRDLAKTWDSYYDYD